MGEIVRINLNQGTVSKEVIPAVWQRLGGRGLTSAIIAAEVPPTADALGDSNKLVIAPGLLTGTVVPCSARISIGAKSPLTGGIKESNAGGTVARKLARLGIRALVLEGQLETLSIIFVGKGKVEIFSTPELEGRGNYTTVETLKQRFGDEVGIISIGPAGERLYGLATVAITSPDGYPSRHCGRGGMGAVMGSKKVKAIVIDDNGADDVPLNIADKETFNQVAREWAKAMVESKKTLTNLGTAFLVNVIGNIGALPTRNFTRGTFEGASKINGDALAETIKTRGGKTGHACSPGCVIRCSNVFVDEKGDYVTSGLEYETITLLGANLEIDNLDVIAQMDRLCDDYGMDTMETGNALGVAMEAGLISFGDSEGAIKLIHEMGKGTILGRILGQGATITGKVLGIKHVAAVKGQGMAAYDPRGMKGNGVTYATSPMGADHTAGNALPGRLGNDPASAANQIQVSRDLQIMSTVVDTMGLCLFVGPLPPEMGIIAQLLTAAEGQPVSLDDVLALGRQVIAIERQFNLEAGLGKTSDRLPEFMKKEALSPKGLVFDIPDEDLDKVWEA